MADVIELRPPQELDWTRPVPGSKSITNRALLFAALADGTSMLSGWLDADDTRHMRACLDALGVSVREHDGALQVVGAGGRFHRTADPLSLYVGTAGTVARFLLAAIAASPVEALVDGTPRMRERPMAMLLNGLERQNVPLVHMGERGFLPVRVGPRLQPLAGGEVRLDRPASSQFVSGLVISAALANAPTQIVLEQGTPARPYVDMTLACLHAFGGSARWQGDTIIVEPSSLQAQHYAIEPDASAASYPLTLAAIHGGRAQVPLGSNSLQGDAAFAHVLGRMGAQVSQTSTTTEVHGPQNHLQGGTFDLTDMPDMTLTLAVAALHARGATHVHGVEILRHHESDRLAVAATELRKLGATVEERDDGLSITPPEQIRRGVEIDTYDDHRVAMAFAMAGHVRIRDPACVGKTYPDYFNHLEQAGMVVARG